MNIELSDKQAEFLIRALVCNYGEKDTDFQENIADNGIGYEIIGKLAISSESLTNSFYQTEREKVYKDRINKKIFMGNGWHSKIDTNLLHKRLHFAFHELGIMEQNGGMGTVFDEELSDRNIKNIKSVLNDIIYAFGMTPKDLIDTEGDNK